MKKIFFFICLLAGSSWIAYGQLAGYGKLLEFSMKDKAEHMRAVQVFIPRNLDREVPAKVLWYFRGTNGVRITWNIETSRIYQIGFAEKTVIVAPNLFNKVWSKGTDETDHYLVHDIIVHLKKLSDENGVPYKLNLDNMGVIGFSAGGGFSYHLAGLYPKLFGAIVFRKFLSHARPLFIKMDRQGNAVEDGGGKPDVQVYNILKQAFASVYAREKPVFMLSMGLLNPKQKKSDQKALRAVQALFSTRDFLSAIGYKTSLLTIPGLGHRFQAGFSKDFARQIRDFFFPLHVTGPVSSTIWEIKRSAPAMMKITWQTLPQAGNKIDLELISAADYQVFVLGRNLDNTGVFHVDSNALPARAGRFFIKISTPNKLYFNYSDPFKMEHMPGISR